MKLKQWVKTPKAYVTYFMLAFLTIASLGSHTWKGAINAFIAVIVALAFDVLCSVIAKRKRIVPDGAAITGLIVALILSIASPWYIIVSTSAISILSKHLITYKNRPIFNPATFGLLVSVPLFHTQQSWWGAFGDLSGWYVMLLLIGGYWVVNRVQKFPQVFAFLGVYLLTLLAISRGILPLDVGALQAGGFYDALRPPFINATLFFALLMLTDPPTSPAKTGDQIVFGSVAALAGAIIYGLYGGLIYLYIGLLIGNSYKWIRAKFFKRIAKPGKGEVPKTVT